MHHSESGARPAIPSRRATWGQAASSHLARPA